MKQGAAKAALSERKDDLYETPQCAIRTLLMHETFPGKKIWEPCAGRGAISRELVAAGYDVVAQDLVPYTGADSDIATPIDFLMELRAPDGVACMVTNPPYKLSDEFIRHGLRLGLRVIVLLRLMAIEGANRSDIVDNHLIRVWAGRERLPFMHREGYEGVRNSNSGAPFAWFVFDPTPRGALPINLQRMSWRVA